MEALTAASVAALTIYDMTKALDKRIEIQDIYLLEKTGGKSGDFRQMRSAAVIDDQRRRASGQRDRHLRAGGCRSVSKPRASRSWSGRIVPDERPEIAAALRAIALTAWRADVIFTTGGTGVAPRDVTPEATRDVIEREMPGFGELMRARGLEKTRFAPLSRALAGSRGSVLIVNLPGSPRGAVESLDAILGLVPHVLDLLEWQNRARCQPKEAQSNEA